MKYSSNPSAEPQHERDAAGLAANWVTIWQSELAAVAGDVELWEMFSTVLTQSLSGAAQAYDRYSEDSLAPAPGSTAAPARGGPGSATPPARSDLPGTDAPSRPASPAAAPDAREAFRSLERRLARLERRLDAALGAAGSEVDIRSVAREFSTD